MPFRNLKLRLLIGNVQSRILGRAPVEVLDRGFNPSRYDGVDGGDPQPGIPSVFDPATQTFLTGVLPAMRDLLRRQGIRYRIHDLRPTPERRYSWSLAGYELREYQRTVVHRAVRFGSGLIDIGTGGGKTLLAAAIIAALGLPTLYIVTTRPLLRQSVEHLEEYLGIEVGIVGQGERRPGELTVALVQTLARGGGDLSTWKDGVLVFDEGHHACAPSYLSLIKRIDARHNYYLSAVPFRAGDDQAVLDGMTGRSLTDRAYSARFLIDSGYACPVEISIEPCRISGDMTEQAFGTLYKTHIVHNVERNRQIVSVSGREVRRGKLVLILVDHKAHGARLLEGLSCKAAFIHGDLSKRDVHDQVLRFRDGRIECLVSTAGLMSEGVNIPRIDVLVQAGGLKSRVKILQALGRGLRRDKGKSRLLYVDFFDDDTLGVFRAHSEKRIRVLRNEGFHVPPVRRMDAVTESSEPVPPAWTHVPKTNRFVLLSAEGEVKGRALCLRRDLVPDKYCKRCEVNHACEKGGLVQWQDSTE